MTFCVHSTFHFTKHHERAEMLNVSFHHQGHEVATGGEQQTLPIVLILFRWNPVSCYGLGDIQRHFSVRLIPIIATVVLLQRRVV